MKKFIKPIVVTTLLVSLLAGCGSSSDNTSKVTSVSNVQSDYNSAQSRYDVGLSAKSSNLSGGSYDGSDYYMDAEDTSYEADYDYDSGSGNINNSNNENIKAELTLSEEKLVYSCNVSIETTEYQDSLDKLNELIEQYNGVIQSTYEYDNANNWYVSEYTKSTGTLNCELNIRIPSSNYKALTESLGTIGKVRSKQSTVENISQEYYDTSTRIEVYQKEQERLLEMMDSATTIEDMITIEHRLSTVESELAILQTNIRYMDMDVAYSYVNVTLKEVMEYSNDPENRKTNTFLDRLLNTIEDAWKGLGSNLEGLLFTIIILAPYIIIIAVIIVIYNKLLKNKVKALKIKRRDKKEAERKEDGVLSMRDMNKIINELNQKIESKKKSDSEQQ